MGVTLGKCLLQECLDKQGLSVISLSVELRAKPEKLLDYIEGKRIMPLKTAISIARAIDCKVEDLYEIEEIH
ncbi:helix-turn-helix domain-containing protein [Paenibacillus tarimensis]|uniref:helix-turn-helix domain-containing protein n=1 Tax=Paenibacillus tarimensis TaxID=416012 RepID=UPI001F466800|nr:helix-turn-helix transcriptional regulator [Paenibacillus tarimensis]MCF2946464.1 helix-turn-helix transcriptional regulator [Paenibacillus tarimensis]